MASPLRAWVFKIAKIMSCLRLRAILSRPMSLAMAKSSAIDFFFNSVRFIDRSLAVGQMRDAIISTNQDID